MDIRGIWRKWKEQKRTNQKIKKLKEKKDIKEIWGNSKKKTHQSENGKLQKENPEIHQNRKTWKSTHKRKNDPRNSDQARGDGAWESRESELQADAH